MIYLSRGASKQRNSRKLTLPVVVFTILLLLLFFNNSLWRNIITGATDASHGHVLLESPQPNTVIQETYWMDHVASGYCEILIHGKYSKASQSLAGKRGGVSVPFKPLLNLHLDPPLGYPPYNLCQTVLTQTPNSVPPAQ